MDSYESEPTQEGAGEARLICGAKGRSGKPCGKPAGWGTKTPGFGRCRLHGGATPNGIVSAERKAASFIADTYGLPRSGKADPRDVLLEEMMRTLGHIDWLSEIIRALDPSALVMNVTKVSEGERPYGELGLAGRVWEVVETAAPSVWIDLYRKEREHVYRLAKDIAALGLLERQVQLEEAQAGLMATLMIRCADRLGLTAEQQALWPVILAEELRKIDAAEAVIDAVET